MTSKFCSSKKFPEKTNYAMLIIISVFAISIIFSPKPLFAKDWALSNPPLTGSQLYDVVFITPQEGFAVGANGVIVHCTDSGRTWDLQKAPVDYPGFLLSIDFANDTGYAVGGVFGRTFALMTPNKGKNWIDYSSRFPKGGLRNIHIQNNAIWVTHWNRTPNVSVSRDRCNTWTSDTIGEGSLLGDILFISDSIGFVCGDKGYIGTTIDGGRCWSSNDDTIKGIFKGISVVGNNLYILDGRGGIILSPNLGTSWNYSLSTAIGSVNYFALFFRDNPQHEGFFIGQSNPNYVFRIKMETDGNFYEEFGSLPIFSQVQAVAATSNDRTIGVCFNGAIYEIFGLADSCKELTSNTGGDITTIDFYDSVNGICGTNAGELFITANGGLTWEKNQLLTKNEIVSITAFQNGRTLAINNISEKYISLDYGQTWTADNDSNNPLNIGNTLTPGKQIFKDSTYSNCAYVVKNDSIFLTNDAGKKWQRQGIFSSINSDNNEKRNRLTSLSFTDITTGWGVTIGGAVSYTNDTGRTWIPISNIPDIAANDIFFIDKLHGWVCGVKYAVSPTQPQIYYTNNGGKTWNPSQEMHFDSVLDRHTDLSFSAEMLKIAGTNIQALWALSSEGPLFSSDSGKTWKQQMLPQYGNRFSDMFVGTNGEIFVAGDNSRIWKGNGYTASLKMPFSNYFNYKNNLFQTQRINVYSLNGRKLSACHNGVPQVKGAASGVYIEDYRISARLRDEARSRLLLFP